MDSCEYHKGISSLQCSQKDTHSHAAQNIVLYVEQHCHKMFGSQVKSQKRGDL